MRTSPGTSSDSNTFRGYRYDVFLSFRGKETRKTITDHLYTALDNAGFLTFRDDDELERGEDIKSDTAESDPAVTNFCCRVFERLCVI